MSKIVTVQPYQLELVVSPPIRCNAAQILAYGRAPYTNPTKLSCCKQVCQSIFVDLCMAELLRKKIRKAIDMVDKR